VSQANFALADKLFLEELKAPSLFFNNIKAPLTVFFSAAWY